MNNADELAPSNVQTSIQLTDAISLDFQRQKLEQRKSVFRITVICCCVSIAVSLLTAGILFFGILQTSYGKELFYFALATFISPTILLLNLIKGCYQSDKIDDTPITAKIIKDGIFGQ